MVGSIHLEQTKTEGSDKSNRIWKESNLTDETLHELCRINREVSPSTDSSLGFGFQEYENDNAKMRRGCLQVS